jgi:hypothetical protein
MVEYTCSEAELKRFAICFLTQKDLSQVTS